MKKKLSQAQANVVNALMENVGSYIKTSRYYNFQQIVSATPIEDKFNKGYTTFHLQYFTKPTLDALLRTGCLKEIFEGAYQLK